MSLLDLIFKCFTVTKQIISRMYTLHYALLYALYNLEALKRKWETDLEEPISEPAWQKIIQRIYSSPACLRHAVI